MTLTNYCKTLSQNGDGGFEATDNMDGRYWKNNFNLLQFRVFKYGSAIILGLVYFTVTFSSANNVLQIFQDVRPQPVAFGNEITPESLSRYIIWHSENRKLFVKNSSLSHPEVLVWGCPNNQFSSCAGIGNRIRSIQFSFLLAIITRRLFFINWPDFPAPLLEGLVPSLVDWRLPKNVNIDDVPTILHNESPKFRWLKCPQNEMASTQRETCQNGSTLVDMRKTDFRIWFQNIPVLSVVGRASEYSVRMLVNNNATMYNYTDLSTFISEFRLLRLLVQFLFQPSKQTNILLDMTVPPEWKDEYFSFHIRVGDGTSEGNDPRFANVVNKTEIVEFFFGCAKSLGLHRMKRAYLATDSEEIKRKLIERATKLNIQVAYSKSTVIHVGRSEGKRLSTAAAKSAFLNVFLDFFALARSKAILSNGSSFSRIAFLIGTGNDLLTLNIGGSGITTNETFNRIFNIHKCPKTFRIN